METKKRRRLEGKRYYSFDEVREYLGITKDELLSAMISGLICYAYSFVGGARNWTLANAGTKMYRFKKKYVLAFEKYMEVTGDIRQAMQADINTSVEKLKEAGAITETTPVARKTKKKKAKNG